MSQPLRPFLLLSLLAACSDRDEGGPASSTATGPWQRFEAVIDYPLAAKNPFDPDEVEIDATFEAPDGATYVVPAFVYQGYERSLDGGRERLSPVGPREWRVRFRPPYGTSGGTWTWHWRARTADGEETSAPQSLTPQPAATGHGIVRASGVDHRYLVFEDGAPFFAVGENMAWYDARGTYAYDDWMEKLAAQGGNYIRLWMPSWAFGLEWIVRDAAGAVTSSSLGDYGARLDRAWQLDHVLDRAEALGLVAMLTLLNHGPWSVAHASQWDDNPYNAENGGPLAAPTDVFTDARARALHRRLFRYIVARWGHAPNILAWELWNEVDLVADPASPEVTAWTRDMAQELDRLDPYDHLVTTSLGGIEVLFALLNDDIAALSERFAFWSLPEIDFTQLHFYGIGTTRIDFSTDVARLATYLHAFDKPVLIAEAGVNANGAAETLANDPEGIAFHDILWSGLFAESFGTGMSWWWDDVTDPEDYYPQLSPVAELVKDVRFDVQRFVLVAAEADAPGLVLGAHVLAGETITLAWVKDPRHQWFEPVEAVVERATLVIPDVPPGRWQITWIDPWALVATVTSEIDSAGTPLELPIPAFSRDIALRLEAVE